ncbi:type II toxin-antitoxin system RelE/ParE family toxin [Candidatus Woesearchaeota archaeon]|nr:type II toxin-antitoxin system RelE/ParE family toxin [Candidatus Woesearchaeota archaeon]
MYVLELDPDAVSFLKKLPREIARRIWGKILSAKEDPHHFFMRLAGRRDYRMRCGDYRVIADIEEHEKKIRVTLIGHRKNVYERP